MARALGWLLILLILTVFALLAGRTSFLRGGAESVKVRVDSGPLPASGNEAEPVVRKKPR